MIPTLRTPLRKMRLTAILCLATAVITVFASTANAAPRQGSAAPTYDASWNASSLTLKVHNATVSTDDGRLVIRDSAGGELFQMPLAYRMEYLQFPIDARQAGNEVTLVPSRDKSRAVSVNRTEVDQVRDIGRKQVAAPETRQQRDDEALKRLQSQISAGTSIGTLVGTIVGVIAGGAIGCILGITAAVVGCLVGIPPAAAIGGVVGLALVGGGTLIGAAIQYFQTINSPFVPPRR